MAGTTGDGGRVRTYRGHLGSMIFLALLCAVFGGLFAFFGLLLVIGAGAPAAVAIPFCAAALALFLLAFCVVRGVTVVGDDGLTLRWLRTRRLAWADLVAVELEHNEPASAQRKRPVMGVVVYHRDGRRVSLPNVIDTRSLSAHREVAVIREVWERNRGADRTPRPEVTGAARARAGASARDQNSVVEALWWGRTAVRVLVFGMLIVVVLSARIAAGTGVRRAANRRPGEAGPGAGAGAGRRPLRVRGGSAEVQQSGTPGSCAAGWSM
ncbi:PH domain-containing protein [Streptomyces sp. WAC 06738]|uniref:PH domain-containing protein n=1 Tax=Streptomyces sp. WAC 06738 TaxID=2203210 RepID=UPI001F0CCDBB|nr:PH domain-containing protein [Streptomyces sp. WAC 06738]